jgi:hypothetical protein
MEENMRRHRDQNVVYIVKTSSRPKQAYVTPTETHPDYADVSGKAMFKSFIFRGWLSVGFYDESS